MFKMFLFAIICLTFVSCSHITTLRTADNMTAYTESDPDKVEVFSTSKIGKQYIVIGEVLASADAGENSEKTVELLKDAASKLGADAVIDFRLSFCQGGWMLAITATGTAVKYK